MQCCFAFVLAPEAATARAMARQRRKIVWEEPEPGECPDMDSPAADVRPAEDEPRWATAR
jgi:hypothetical protein